MNQSPFR